MSESAVIGGAIFWRVNETGSWWRSLSERTGDVEILAHYPPESRTLSAHQGGRFNGTCEGPWVPGVVRCASRLMFLRAMALAGLTFRDGRWTK